MLLFLNVKSPKQMMESFSGIKNFKAVMASFFRIKNLKSRKAVMELSFSFKSLKIRYKVTVIVFFPWSHFIKLSYDDQISLNNISSVSSYWIMKESLEHISVNTVRATFLLGK